MEKKGIFIKMKYKNIKYAVDDDFTKPIKPSSHFIPDWYSNSKELVGEKPKIKNYGTNKGIKKCIPFLDSLTSGYMIELWTDVQVKQTDLGPSFTWMTTPDPITTFSNEGVLKDIPIPFAHFKKHFSWLIPTFMQLPNGYSAIFTHPFNRHDLPFTSLTGIVDLGNSSTMFPGEIPFFIKEGFEGIIPFGTPIVQIIPFKRDNWKILENKDIIDDGKKSFYNAKRIFSGFYKTSMWKRKEYL